MSPENPYPNSSSITIHLEKIQLEVTNDVSIRNDASHYLYTLSEQNLTFEEKENIKEYLITSSIEPQYDLLNAKEKTYLLGLLALDVLKKNSNFDLVHAHDWMTFEALSLIKETYPHLTLISHIHSTEYDRAGEIHLNHKILNIEKMGLEISHRIIAVSHYTEKQLIEKFKVSKNKIFVVYNANNEQHVQKLTPKKTTDMPIVTFVGRITFQKGPSYFVLAAKKVLEKIPNVQFHVIGTGDLLNAMKQLVWELELNQNFHFEGFLNAQGVQDKLAQSDMFVMPSVSEPFGIVALEAIAQNIPVILSKQSGVSEVLNHTLKVDFWDTELLADRILSLLKYSLLKEAMVENSLKDLQQRTWAHSAQTLLNVYQGI